MKRLVAAFALIAGLALPTAALAQYQSGPAPVAPSVSSAQVAGGWVSIVDFAFDPNAVYVAPGGTVTWSNIGGAAHTVTSTGGAFDSGAIGSGGGFSVTFQGAGMYGYYCAIHPAMTGTVIVS